MRHDHYQTPRRRSPLPLVLGILAAIVLVVGGVLLERTLLGRHETPAEATSAAAQGAAGEDAGTNAVLAGDAAPSSTEPLVTPDAATTSEGEASEVPRSTTPATIEAMMVGDVLMHDEVVQSGMRDDGTYDYGFVYDHITDHLGATDLRLLNQETVMGEPERGYNLYMGAAGPIMNTPTALADTEAAYGFNVILKATNHVLDLGYSGLGHELDYWKAAHPEIAVVGVNNPNAPEDDESQNYVDNVYVFEKDGLKVGILNYTWATNENFDWDLDHRYVSYMSEDKIRADVEKARAAGAEMLIACPHWGIEYDTTPSEEENHYAKIFCDLGVDVIFGCHPHILQPVEILRNAEGHRTVCFYSMSDFVAAGQMQTRALIGGVARCTLSRDDAGGYAVTAASLYPTVICYTYGPNMTAWPITQWTPDLAAQSYRSDLTPDFAYSFCSAVLGDGFDPSTGVFTLDMSQEGRLV